MHPELSKAHYAKDIDVLTPTYLRAKRWILHSSEYPVLDVEFTGKQPLRVRLNCEDWPDLPPAAELLTPAGDHLMTGVEPFNGSAHPTTGRPFVCLPGFREFHTHPSHLSETWSDFRGLPGMNLAGLLSQLSSAWRKAKGA